MNFDPTLHLVAQIFSERLLSSLVGGAILALVAWIALRLIGQLNSRTRFLVWFATLLGIAALPVLGRWELANRTSAEKPALLSLPETWALYIFAAWALIALMGITRIVVGLIHLRRIRKSCTPVDVTTLDVALRNELQEFARTRPVTLCISNDVRVPSAIGFGKALVVLPAWSFADLSAQELRSVVLHELQHLRRRDDWTNLLQRFVGALFFFHPAVWFLQNRLELEREMACDDAVIAQTENPRAYARCLVSLAEKSYLRRGVAMAQAAVSRMTQMTARIAQILSPNRPANAAGWKPAMYIVAIVSMVGGTTVAVAPQLVAFESSPVAAVGEPMPPSQWVHPASFEQQPAMTPHVVPTGLKQSEPAHPSKRAAVKVHRKPQVDAPLLLAVKPPAIPPMAVSLQQEAPAEVVLVVLRTQQTDASGMLWNVSVVRWVVYHPPVPQVVHPAAPTRT